MSVSFDREVDRRASPILLNIKQYTIPSSSPYMISLEEVPEKSNAVTITGMTEVSAMPTATNTFYVDYLLGDIYFHSSNAGQQVTPSYWGRGSIIRAADSNKVYDYLEKADFVASTIRASAQDTPGRSIKIDSGVFYYASERKSYAGNSNVNMGPGGAYQLTALTQNYFNKILFTLDSIAVLKRYEGIQAGTKANVVTPNLPIGEIPICMITIQDDGTGQAGTINNIQSADIEDLRTFFWLPGIKHSYLTVHLEGFPILNDVFFDGYYFPEAVSIDKITLSARSAPSGSNLQIEILKNGIPTGKVATLSSLTLIGVTRSNLIRAPRMQPASDRSNLNLPNLVLAGLTLARTTLTDLALSVRSSTDMFVGGDGRLYESTILNPAISFTTSDILGLKVVAVDSGETAEGVQILMNYS